MVVEGNVRIDGDLLQKRDAMGIWDTDKINIEVNSDCELLVLDVPMQANYF